MSGNMKFVVLDRKNRQLSSFDIGRDLLSSKMTMGELIELVHSKTDKLSKMDINRCWFNLGNH